MNETENRRPLGKILVTGIVLAIISAVAAAIVQRLIIGEINPAVTGGVAGDVSVIATAMVRNRG